MLNARGSSTCGAALCLDVGFFSLATKGRVEDLVITLFPLPIMEQLNELDPSSLLVNTHKLVLRLPTEMISM